jgi:predicted nucleic acid-binding protein
VQPVVSDTGPLHYLVLTNAIDVLPKLFSRILVPDAVVVELSHPETPLAVRTWLQSAPPWIDCGPNASTVAADSLRRGAGERAAINLAESVGAQMLLIDDRAGVVSARSRGLETIGTLGVMVRAAQLDLLDLRDAFAGLRATNFRCSPEMLDALLIQHDAIRR